MAEDVADKQLVTDAAAGNAQTERDSEIVAKDSFANPGFPPHRSRITDNNPKKERRAQRTVFVLFMLSVIGSLSFIVAYVFLPIEDGSIGSIRNNNLFLGLSATLALFGIGFGAVHWSKAIMQDVELVDERHKTGGSEQTNAIAAKVFQAADNESGFSRRTIIRRSLIGALIAFPLPSLMLLRGFAPQNEDPIALLKHTMWKKGTRLALDPSGTPIKAADVTVGSAFHVIPADLNDLEEGKLNEKAKAAVLLMRLDQNDLNEREDRKDWSYQGIVAYSKICTHVGCPVALYEQHTHHLLCPCHQSQFDVSNHCEVIFGPAKRPLPQLPITIDAEGYLIAQSDFLEPVGPSFWERT